jgi:hypothetical protein
MYRPPQQQNFGSGSDYFIIFVLCDTGEIEIPAVFNSLRNAQYFVNNFKHQENHIQIWISEGEFGEAPREIPGTSYTF